MHATHTMHLPPPFPNTHTLMVRGAQAVLAHTHEFSRMLAYSHVCSRTLTYADACAGGASAHT
jgi:hypothetical protein